jgi:hypothetical protein
MWCVNRIAETFDRVAPGSKRRDRRDGAGGIELKGRAHRVRIAQ